MQGKVEICGINTAKLKTLTHQEMDTLLHRAKAGDEAAREKLIEGNLRLVLSVIQRFSGRGENPDDLFQVGCIGLLKAIANFDPTKEVRKMSLLEVNARYALAYDKFIEKYGYDAIAVSCWPKFQDDYLFSVCAVVGEINDKGVVCGCEGDLTSTVSQLLLSYIAEDITMLMDLSAMDENDNSIMMWHCGPAAKRFCEKKGYSYSLNYSGKDHEGRDLDHAVGTGITRDMVFDDDVYTIARLTGESNKMFLASGVMQDGSKASYNGSRGWLGQLKLNRKDISALDFFNTIMVHGFQHHFPMVKGDYTEEVMEVMAWLGLECLEAVPYENYLQR